MSSESPRRVESPDQTPPQSYAQVVASPMKVASSPISPVRSSVTINKVKHSVETKLSVKCVYMIGLPYQKIGQLRKNMKTLGFYINSIINLSYIGKTIVECVMKDVDMKKFKHVAKKNKLKVFERFDPCDYNDHSLDVYLAEYKIGLKPSEIRAQFIERIANECLKSEHCLTEEFYREWARQLNAIVQFNQIAGIDSSQVISTGDCR